LDADPACIGMRVSEEFFPMINKKAGGAIYPWTPGFYLSAHQVARRFGYEPVLQLLRAGGSVQALKAFSGNAFVLAPNGASLVSPVGANTNANAFAKAKQASALMEKYRIYIGFVNK
jgi:hypothetical protein